MCIYIYIFIYLCIYTEREREKKKLESWRNCAHSIHVCPSRPKSHPQCNLTVRQVPPFSFHGLRKWPASVSHDDSALGGSDCNDQDAITWGVDGRWCTGEFPMFDAWQSHWSFAESAAEFDQYGCCWEAKDGQIWWSSHAAAVSREEMSQSGLWRPDPQMGPKFFGTIKMTLAMLQSVPALRKRETQKTLSGSIDLLKDGLMRKDRKYPTKGISRTSPFLWRFWIHKPRNPLTILKENDHRKDKIKPKRN